jgi:hypothetical protein
MTASPLGQVPGQPVTLTATTNAQVTPPLEIQIYDAYNTNRLPNAVCTNCSLLTVQVTESAPTAPYTVAYSAVVGTDSAVYGNNGQQIVATSGLFPSWLNPPKLYAYRLTPNHPIVNLITDGGGTKIYGPWHILIFNETTGALVSDCPPSPTPGPGFGTVFLCGGSESFESGGSYQTIVSLGGTDPQSAFNNDERAISHSKCVDPIDLAAPTIC